MSNSVTPRRGQERFIADTDETGLGAVDAVADESAPTSVWSEAWRYLRRRPLFWIAATLILIALLLALVPQWFTSVKPDACVLQESLRGPRPGHPFGFNRQGCDIYSRTVYGARASVAVGVLTTLLVVIIGTLIGSLAGYIGGFLDSVLSRITDIFFAIPLVLAAIVVMQMFKEQRTIVTVVLVLGIFGWTSIARITRGAVMSVKNDEYVTAAKASGVEKQDFAATHPAERCRADHRVRDSGFGHLHCGGSNAVLPGYRPAADNCVVGWGYFQRTGIATYAAHGAVLPGHGASADGAQLHHDG